MIVPWPRGAMTPRRFAPRQEAAEARHLPDLEIFARRLPRGLGEGTLAPMLKTATSSGPTSRSIALDERHDIFFLARVAAEGARRAAFGFDLRRRGARASRPCAARRRRRSLRAQSAWRWRRRSHRPRPSPASLWLLSCDPSCHAVLLSPVPLSSGSQFQNRTLTVCVPKENSVNRNRTEMGSGPHALECAQQGDLLGRPCHLGRRRPLDAADPARLFLARAPLRGLSGRASASRATSSPTVCASSSRPACCASKCIKRDRVSNTA